MPHLYSASEPMERVFVTEQPLIHWRHRYSGYTACGQHIGRAGWIRTDVVVTCLWCVARVEC